MKNALVVSLLSLCCDVRWFYIPPRAAAYCLTYGYSATHLSQRLSAQSLFATSSGLATNQENDDEAPRPWEQEQKGFVDRGRVNPQAKKHHDQQLTRRKNLQRRTPSARQQRDFDSLLKRFRNSKEIDEWMRNLVGFSDLPFPRSWSSRDETDFIRCLRDRGAYYALEVYACHLARKNVFVYTAAISAMANCPKKRTRQKVLMVLDKMDEVSILPSAQTFVALFQSTNGPVEARMIMARLQKYRGKTRWSVEAFNQAIMACARKEPRQQYATNLSWQVALEFSRALRREGLRPNLKTHTSLLHVCAQTGQLRIALEIVREIEEDPSIKANARVWGALLNVCAQAGDHKQANGVLKMMQKEGHHINLAHCSALLKALSRNGNVAASLAVLDMMTGLNSATEESHETGHFQLVKLPPIAPDLVALNTILACCAKGKDFKSARRLLDRMKDGEFSAARTSQSIYPDEISYSLLLSCCRETDTAKDILKEMHLSKRYRVGVVRPNQITYARLVGVCAKADIPDVECARFFLSSARKDGIEPTVFMYTAAIWTAERSGNYTFAKEVLDEMKTVGVAANSISYAGVISTAAKAGLVDEAFALYEELKSAGGSPTAATYNALALAVRQSKASNKLEKLEAIFDTMDVADRCVEVSGAVMEAMIAEHGRQGAYGKAKKIFDMIEGPTNGPCLRAMLSACATAGTGPKWQEISALPPQAIAILHSSDITANAMGPGGIDQGALSNAVIACAKADCWEEGLNLLQLYGVRTTSRCPSVSIVALNAVIAACGRKGRPDVAVRVFNDMEKRYGVKPNERTYRSAIIACNQAEHQKRRHQSDSSSSGAEGTAKGPPSFEWWECALALLRRMKEDGLKPDKQTMSSCISACEAAGQWQRALGVLQSVIDEHDEEDGEKFLNMFCFNAAISSCEKGGAWVEALEIYERMVSYGGSLRPNFVSLSSLVLALANAGQKELALSKYQEGVAMKIVNPWRTTRDHSGKPLKAMDLHMFNSVMACCAVQSFIESLLACEEATEDELVIIVGKGLRSAEKAKLLPLIQELLNQEYGITAKLDQDNMGRLVVDSECLRTLVSGRGSIL